MAAPITDTPIFSTPTELYLNAHPLFAPKWKGTCAVVDIDPTAHVITLLVVAVFAAIGVALAIFVSPLVGVTVGVVTGLLAIAYRVFQLNRKLASVHAEYLEKIENKYNVSVDNFTEVKANKETVKSAEKGEREVMTITAPATGFPQFFQEKTDTHIPVYCGFSNFEKSSVTIIIFDQRNKYSDWRLKIGNQEIELDKKFIYFKDPSEVYQD